MKIQTLLKSALLAASLCGGAALTAEAQYCIPTYGTGCSLDDDINDFTVNGAGSSVLSDLSTGCSNGAYRNMSLTMSVNMEQGGIYQALIASTYYNENAEVYIDFNNDGSFSSTESVGGAGYIDDLGVYFNLHIPQTAQTGAHRMRVVSSYDYLYPGINPCPTVAGGFEYGEVHDYTANIITASGPFCDAPPVTSASSLSDVSAVLHWLPVTGSIGYEYTIDQNQNAPMVPGTFTTANTYTATGLSPNTVYQLHVRSKCGATSFSPWMTQQFVTTATAPTCADPGGFTVSSLSGTSATLAWTAAPGNPDYEVFVSSVFLYPLTGSIVTTNGASYNGLTPNSTYYAWVRKYCGTSVSDWAVLTFTTNSTPGPAQTSVYGNLYAGNNAVLSTDTYMVWLINYNTTTNTLTAVDSQSTDVGTYYFTGMPAGNYLVKAAQITASTTVLGQVPTYRDSSLYWSTALTVAVTGQTANQHIWMREGIVTSGPGFIGGNVSLGANKGTGSGVPNQLILLRNAAGKMIKAIYTDVNGDYAFSNLPTGSYSIYPEQLGYSTTAFVNVTLTASQASKTEVSFNQDDLQKNIKPRNATGIAGSSWKNAGLRLSPNPASDEVRIGVQGAQAGMYTATIRNLVGQAVLQQQFEGGETTLRIAALPAGTYSVRVQGKGFDAVQKLVVQP